MNYLLLRQNIEREIILTDNEWRSIVKKIEFVRFKKNEFLQLQDSNSSYVAFVLKGSFKIYVLNENGCENIIFFTFENNWICDIGSFYHNRPTKYCIKAMEDSEVLIINRLNKMLLVQQIPKLIPFQMLMLQKLNKAIEKRLLDFLNKTCKQRYIEFAKKYPDKIFKITDRNLSSYIGVSHEFLSKIKKEIHENT